MGKYVLTENGLELETIIRRDHFFREGGVLVSDVSSGTFYKPNLGGAELTANEMTQDKPPVKKSRYQELMEDKIEKASKRFKKHKPGGLPAKLQREAREALAEEKEAKDRERKMLWPILDVGLTIQENTNNGVIVANTVSGHIVAYDSTTKVTLSNVDTKNLIAEEKELVVYAGPELSVWKSNKPLWKDEELVPPLGSDPMKYLRDANMQDHVRKFSFFKFIIVSLWEQMKTWMLGGSANTGPR